MMRFYDRCNDNIYSLADIAKDYRDMQADPKTREEYIGSLQAFLLHVLLDTEAGRTDLEVIGMTRKELNKLISRLWKYAE